MRSNWSAAMAAFAAFSLAGLGASAEPQIDPSSLEPGDEIARIAVDLDGDGAADVATLLVGVDIDADLTVELSSGGLVVVEAMAWRGGLYGTQPGLAVSDRGSLLVTAENSAIGRWRWRETTTIAYRGGALVVAGYTFAGYDTIDGTQIDCDVNLLTGAAVYQGARRTGAPRRIPLARWPQEGASIRECL